MSERKFRRAVVDILAEIISALSDLEAEQSDPGAPTCTYHAREKLHKLQDRIEADA